MNQHKIDGIQLNKSVSKNEDYKETNLIMEQLTKENEDLKALIINIVGNGNHSNYNDSQKIMKLYKDNDELTKEKHKLIEINQELEASSSHWRSKYLATCVERDQANGYMRIFENAYNTTKNTYFMTYQHNLIVQNNLIMILKHLCSLSKYNDLQNIPINFNDNEMKTFNLKSLTQHILLITTSLLMKFNIQISDNSTNEFLDYQNILQNLESQEDKKIEQALLELKTKLDCNNYNKNLKEF